MYCLNCGSQIPEAGRFCTRCGAANTPQEAGTLFKPDKLMGTLIGGKYRIDGRIGAGGMGTVYRARRLLIGDDVALKVLHPELASDPLAGERFRREAQAAARLKHPHAVTVYDFGVSQDGLLYLVMELVHGKSLRQVIRERGPILPSTANEIVSQVCVVLEEAHRQHIVHRDLKPDNIIVTETAEGLKVKVLDFGIAKLRDMSNTTSSITRSGTMMGTPHYMSPEQCMGEEIDGRSDIYSLGIVLYEMLTGVVPFNSNAPSAVVVQQVTQPPPSLRAINVSVSPQVEEVVMTALEKNREARPQTPAALTEKLTAAVRGLTFAQSSAVVKATRSELASSAAAPSPQFSTPASQSAAPQFPAPVATQQKAAGKRAMIVIGTILTLALIGVAVMLALRWRAAESSQADKSRVEVPQVKPETATKEPDKPIVPSVPPEGMVMVGGGEFLMGSNTGSESERPQHAVTVGPFFIDKYEVTCDEYEEFIRATGRAAPRGWTGGHHPSGAARKPVTGVSWDDAAAYAEWAGKRLPTEEEWEFAARGTTGFRYPWGNEWKPRQANADTSAHGHGGASEVGEHVGASPFGAFDMAGNAWEWTSSDFATYPGGHAHAHPGQKVIRGGSWTSNRNQATATFRKGYETQGGDYSQIGFRCVRDVVSSPTSNSSPAPAQINQVSSREQEKKEAPKAARHSAPSKSKSRHPAHNTQRSSQSSHLRQDDSDDSDDDDRERRSRPRRRRFSDRY